MPFVNGRYYANRIFGRAIELARILSGQAGSLREPLSSEQQFANISRNVPYSPIYSRPKAAAGSASGSDSGLCDLVAGFTPHGVHCEPGKDYHGTAYMDLNGPGIRLHSVDEDTIRVRAEADGDIVSVSGRARKAFGGPLQWQVDFSIKSGAGFHQQGGDIVWTVRYICSGDHVEQEFRQTVYCL